MFYVMVDSGFYFYITAKGYGLSSLKERAQSYSEIEARKILLLYHHWNITLEPCNANN